MSETAAAAASQPCSFGASPPNPILVEVVRGGFVESVHRGSALVLDADGRVLASLGDPDAVTFPRSAVKPLQAVGMLQAGLVLEGLPLAIATGSHSGEPEHADLVRTTLQAAGLSEQDLACPPALPMNEAARNAVLAAGDGLQRAYMNCSGKHTAMLLTCLANGWPTDSYLSREHPLQVHLRGVLGDFAGEVPEAVTVDGCGAPLFGMTLTGLARAFVRFAAESGPARAVADAMRVHPFFVAGTGREDTELMTGLPGVLSKAGAEGVHVVAVPGAGSVVVKIDDGNERARMPVVVAGLRLLGLTDNDLGPTGFMRGLRDNDLGPTGDVPGLTAGVPGPTAGVPGPTAGVLERWATGTVLGGGRPVGIIRAAGGLFG